MCNVNLSLGWMAALFGNESSLVVFQVLMFNGDPGGPPISLSATSSNCPPHLQPGQKAASLLLLLRSSGFLQG